MREHRRDVVDFLRGYGATDVRVIPGGKHPRVAFEFAGKHVERVMSVSPSDHRTSANAIADLRRLLGDPVVSEGRRRRTLNDLTSDLMRTASHHVMMKEEPMPAESSKATIADQIREKLPSLAAQLAPDLSKPTELNIPAEPGSSPRVDLQGWMVACYDNQRGHRGSYIRVSYPRGDGERLGDRLTATELEPGVWRVARSTDGTIGIQPYGPNRVFFQLSVPHMEPFGYTPCEAHAEGDGVVVRLPDVRSSLKHRPKPAVSPARRSELLPRRPLPPQVAPVPTVAVPPSIDDIRAALALIRRIEAETPYRLVRDGGAWVFDPGLARIV